MVHKYVLLIVVIVIIVIIVVVRKGVRGGWRTQPKNYAYSLPGTPCLAGPDSDPCSEARTQKGNMLHLHLHFCACLFFSVPRIIPDVSGYCVYCMIPGVWHHDRSRPRMLKPCRRICVRIQYSRPSTVCTKRSNSFPSSAGIFSRDVLILSCSVFPASLHIPRCFFFMFRFSFSDPYEYPFFSRFLVLMEVGSR